MARTTRFQQVMQGAGAGVLTPPAEEVTQVVPDGATLAPGTVYYEELTFPSNGPGYVVDAPPAGAPPAIPAAGR